MQFILGTKTYLKLWILGELRENIYEQFGGMNFAFMILYINVKEGEAYRCSCIVKEIFLKENITLLERRCIDGYWVNFVEASAVT